MTLLALVVAVTAGAQTLWPYNPDADNDGLISVEDLMSVLSVYGTAWTIDADSSQQYVYALQDAGLRSRGHCIAECMKMNGRIPTGGEFFMWDSLLVTLAPNSSYNYGCDSYVGPVTKIWAYEDLNQAVARNWSTKHILYNQVSSGNDNWIAVNDCDYHNQNYCFCIGVIPNPNFVE